MSVPPELIVYVAAGLHAAFAVLELLPWGNPKLLRKVTDAFDLPELESGEPAISNRFSAQQLQLVATIVHNAGIYNAVLTGGLLWAIVTGNTISEVSMVLCAGAAVAGVFGMATLPGASAKFATGAQALLGAAGAFFVAQQISG